MTQYQSHDSPALALLREGKAIQCSMQLQWVPLSHLSEVSVPKIRDAIVGSLAGLEIPAEEDQLLFLVVEKHFKARPYETLTTQPLEYAYTLVAVSPTVHNHPNVPNAIEQELERAVFTGSNSLGAPVSEEAWKRFQLRLPEVTSPEEIVDLLYRIKEEESLDGNELGGLTGIELAFIAEVESHKRAMREEYDIEVLRHIVGDVDRYLEVTARGRAELSFRQPFGMLWSVEQVTNECEGTEVYCGQSSIRSHLTEVSEDLLKLFDIVYPRLEASIECYPFPPTGGTASLRSERLD